MKPAVITVRLYAELNDFVADTRRKRDFHVEMDGARSIEDVIDFLGVPQAAVDLILVDGQPVKPSYILRGGERVAVYPTFRSLTSSS